jgi:hypothetical protein
MKRLAQYENLAAQLAELRKEVQQLKDILNKLIFKDTYND